MVSNSEDRKRNVRRGDGDSVVTYPGAARADVVGRGENLRSAGNFTSSRLAFSEACGTRVPERVAGGGRCCVLGFDLGGSQRRSR